MIHLESGGISQGIEDRVYDILFHCYSLTNILTGNVNPKKSLKQNQIEFLVKATGDWDSDTFDVTRALHSLEEKGKIVRDEKFNFSCK